MRTRPHRTPRGSHSSRATAESIRSVAIPMKRSIRFNEENIAKTLHPIDKDYGMMQIREAKTPFPHVVEPVDADTLRERLNQTLIKANLQWGLRPSFESLKSDGSDLSSRVTVYNLMSNPGEPRDCQIFEMKRRKFYKSEYTIAKQLLMSKLAHRPCSSISDIYADRCYESYSLLSRYDILDFFKHEKEDDEVLHLVG